MQVKSRLHIIAGFKGSRTYLKKDFCQHPFKLANITEDTSGTRLSVMIRSSSPGILDNDDHHIIIEVEENGHLHLITQGYQRLFSMKNSARQFTEVNLHRNATLLYLPHPVTPHASSDYTAINNIHLQENHTLLWGEIITCGRKESGEAFQFTRYHSVSNIFVNHRLVIKENILLEPLQKNVHAIGQLEGYTHQSTLIFLKDAIDMKPISDYCNKFLLEIKEISFGITLLPVNGLLIRILGNKGEKLFGCQVDLACHIQNMLPAKQAIPATPRFR